jgi:hypothetical protein
MGARYMLQNGGSVVTVLFGREAFFGSNLVSSGTYCPYTDVVSSGDDSGCRQERRKTRCSTGSIGLSLSIAGAVELCQTSRRNSRQASGRSFPEKGGSVAGGIKGTYTASLES